MNVLVTGGTGYIGSHTAVQLQKGGHRVIIVDNLCNSSRAVLKRIRQITGKSALFYKTDLRDYEELDHIFEENKIDAVIHFAGLKAAEESVSMPLRYYHSNITATLNLCDIMSRHGVKRLVFSSSAAVYGNPHTVPIKEDFPLSCTNPYGRTKLFIEDILHDLQHADPEWRITLLRYFSPAGAHVSGLLGEDLSRAPDSLMSQISRVAIGKLASLSIYGDDYATSDGTGVRDYIHVEDLANGHLLALKKMEEQPGGVYTYNLGTGRGCSVLEMLRAFERASGKKIAYQIVPRRRGDIASCYADAEKSRTELGFRAQRGVDEICADTWNWLKKKSNKYPKK